ncbi:hypothetical protein L1987_72514 [Smallanthus sonchifolius]|uniref:Uncharacterized protein n=1 Tax=Smallanthus sonchifolius TaxID=185202 RepID=A0ACB9AW47_9ASTR|nr:hypothetical protein L1987_72514 [Smallanthus sonchifolius]
MKDIWVYVFEQVSHFKCFCFERGVFIFNLKAFKLVFGRGKIQIQTLFNIFNSPKSLNSNLLFIAPKVAVDYYNILSIFNSPSSSTISP